MNEEKDIYKQLDQRGHYLLRSEVHGGTNSIQTYESYVPDTKFKSIKLTSMNYPMILKKIIEEPSTNAIDHARTHPNKVKNIYYSLDDKGYITIINDGPNIPLTKKKTLSGEMKPLPEFLTTEFNTSSNYENTDQTVGGCNGVGIKLTNVWSKHFIVQVSDGKDIFHQECHNNMGTIDEYYLGSSKKFDDEILYPEKKLKSYTAFKFRPDYKRMGYEKITNELLNIIDSILRTQVMVASISIQPKPTIKPKNRVHVYYRDILCPIEDIKQLAIMNTTPIIEHKEEKEVEDDDTVPSDNDSKPKKTYPLIEMIVGETTPYPWHVVLTCDANKCMKPTYFGVVNGIYTSQGGTHIKLIKDQLKAYIKPKFEKMYNKDYGMKWVDSYINFIQIYVSAIWPKPEYDGQRKDALTTNIKLLAKDRDINEKILTKVYNMFKDPIDYIIMAKTAKDEKKESSTKISKEYVAYYYPAQKLGSDSTLCICEGVSAQSNLDKGIRQSDVGTKYIGSLALGGVIPNAIKSSKVITNPLDGNLIRVRDPKLKLNKHIRAFYNVSGLDPSCAYNLDKAGDKAFKELKYGSLLIVTDQDLDGFNIQCLAVALIAIFHPGLFERGYVKILNTPVVKASYKVGKKKQSILFHTEQEYKKWSSKPKTPSHNVVYIKGLATLEVKDLANIFENLNNNTIILNKLSKKDIKELNVYYGIDPDLRKEALSNPPPQTIINLSDVKKGGDGLYIGCSELVHGRAHDYQLDNLDRKIPNLMDGLNQVKRKVIAMVLVLASGKVDKAASFAGKLIDMMAYHHGDASAGTVILKMTQSFYGSGQNIPQLLALGDSGSRMSKIMGATRYVDVCGNVPILTVLYNKYDAQLLTYNYFDGKQIEPKFYIPPVPISLLNTSVGLSNGWNFRIYARDYNDVITNILRLIKSKSIKPMKHDQSNFGGKVVVDERGIEWSCGTYKWNPKNNKLTITELPIFIWTRIFCEGDEAKAKKLHERKMEELKEEKKTSKSKTTKDDTTKKAPSKKLSASQIGVKIPLKYKKYVKSYDFSKCHKKGTDSNMIIDIDVILEDGAYEEIQEKYASKPFDGIEKYFGLNISMKPNLNFITDTSTVTSFSTYEAVLEYWFERRKKFYILRYEREIIMLKLEILYYDNLIRFTDPRNKDEANRIINTKNTVETAISLLNDYNYQMFNKQILHNSNGYLNEELENAILVNGASYEYILNLTCVQRLNKAHKSRVEIRSKLQNRLDILLSQTKYFKGAEMWIEDLKEVKASIDAGIAVHWAIDGDTEVEYIQK